MQKVALFLQPPLNLPADHIDYPCFADLSVLQAAARVARAGWRVQVRDAFAQPGSTRRARPDGGWSLGAGVAALLSAVPDGPVDLVVIGASPFLHPWEPDEDLEALVRGLRSRYPTASLILADCYLGGMHYVEYRGETVLRRLPELDAVVRYAADHLFDQPDRLLGLARAVVEEPAHRDDTPPFPLYEAVDWGLYGAFLHRVYEDRRWANPFGVDAATRAFWTTSGCPHRCVFCTSNPGWRRTGRKVYRVVPRPVVAHWAYLVRQVASARKLFILDEMANLRPDFEDLLAVFESLDLRYEFPNGLRADRLTDRAIARMAGRLGLLCVSAESGSDEDLAGPIGKRQPLREVERVLDAARRSGIPALVHFVVGFPWETPAHVQRTLSLAWRLYEAFGATPAVQFATPIPGSALADQCVQAGLIRPEDLRWPDATLFQHRAAFRPPAIPEGYLEKAVHALRLKVASAQSRKLIINLTYQCINQCVFCAVANRVRRHVPLGRVFAILRDHRQRGIGLLDLDGGEPTLHPHLVRVVRHARAIGYRQVNVTTNARRLAVRRFARRLMQGGVTSLLISLHGSTAEIHEAATRVPGSYRETVAGLRNALALAEPCGVSVGVNTTVFHQNVSDLPALAGVLVSLGVSRWNIQFLTPFGAASRAVAPDPRAAADSVRRVIEEYRDRIGIQVVNAQFCLFPPEFEPYLVADTQKLGRTMVFVTEEEVNLFQYIAARRRRVAACEVCPHVPVCDGFYEFGEPEAEVLDGG